MRLSLSVVLSRSSTSSLLICLFVETTNSRGRWLKSYFTLVGLSSISPTLSALWFWNCVTRCIPLQNWFCLPHKSKQASLLSSLCKVDFLFQVYPRLSLSGYPWLWHGADVSDSPPTFWRPVFLSCYFLDLCLGGCAYFCQPSLALKNNTHSHFTSYLRFLAILCQKGFSGNKVHLIARNMSLLSRLYDILFATQTVPWNLIAIFSGWETGND